MYLIENTVYLLRMSKPLLPQDFVEKLDAVNQETIVFPADAELYCSAEEKEGDMMRVCIETANGPIFAHLPLTDLTAAGIGEGDSFHFLQHEVQKYRPWSREPISQDQFNARTEEVRRRIEGLGVEMKDDQA